MLRDAARKTSTVSLAIFGFLGLALIVVMPWSRFEQAFGPRTAWVDTAGNRASISDGARPRTLFHEVTDRSIHWWAVCAIFTETPILIWLFWHPFKELFSRFSKRMAPHAVDADRVKRAILENYPRK